jgi:MerR family transcriptional regulator, light-induced transcriptional regulator
MLPIGVVARQTGIEIATSRKWESRYGFPLPIREKSGQRSCRSTDVARLLCIVRRTAAGERVSNVIREYHSEYLSGNRSSGIELSNSANLESVKAAINALYASDLFCLKKTLATAFSAYSKIILVEQAATPLARLVGEHWASGQLPIYGEHLV